MPTVNLLYKRVIPINQKISVRIPTVGEVLESEDAYYVAATLLTSMPVDLMVDLDEWGIDYTSIDEYELFLIVFNILKGMDTSLIFENLDLSKFEMGVREENGTIAMIDKENDIVIDRAIAAEIAAALRQINHFEKNYRKPANNEAKEYMLQRAKLKAKRKRMRRQSSQLESLIVALVNTEQYHYGFEGTRELTIYQFNECVRQVIKKIDYDNKMRGVYAGTVSVKDLSQDDLNWLKHK